MSGLGQLKSTPGASGPTVKGQLQSFFLTYSTVRVDNEKPDELLTKTRTWFFVCLFVFYQSFLNRVVCHNSGCHPFAVLFTGTLHCHLMHIHCSLLHRALCFSFGPSNPSLAGLFRPLPHLTENLSFPLLSSPFLFPLQFPSSHARHLMKSTALTCFLQSTSLSSDRELMISQGSAVGLCTVSADTASPKIP